MKLLSFLQGESLSLRFKEKVACFRHLGLKPLLTDFLFQVEEPAQRGKKEAMGQVGSMCVGGRTMLNLAIVLYWGLAKLQ